MAKLEGGMILPRKGFRSVHVEKANYLNWDKDV